MRNLFVGSLRTVACARIILLLHFRTSWLTFLEPIRPVFVFETIALWAFGTAWLVKGELVLADKWSLRTYHLTTSNTSLNFVI